MHILETIISWLAPHNCLVCGREGQLLCAWCLPDTLMPSAAGCFSCGQPTLSGHICTDCRSQVPLEHLWTGTEYEDLAKQLVRHFKFDSARSAAQPMAACMRSALPFLDIDKTVIVPVPTSTGRVRQRGYDHTLLLAKELSKLTDLPFYPALGRRGQTRQVGTKRSQRLQQITGAYYVKKSNRLTNQKVLLLDDVMTTGATISEAAKVLKRAGVVTIYGVVFAQKRYVSK